jgi:hypothetical protein
MLISSTFLFRGEGNFILPQFHSLFLSTGHAVSAPLKFITRWTTNPSIGGRSSLQVSVHKFRRGAQVSTCIRVTIYVFCNIFCSLLLNCVSESTSVIFCVETEIGCKNAIAMGNCSLNIVVEPAWNLNLYLNRKGCPVKCALLLCWSSVCFRSLRRYMATADFLFSRSLPQICYSI